MVFNSFEFLVVFLPLAFAAFVLAQRVAGWPAAFTVVGIASLVFYAQWSLTLLAILVVSVVSNYVIGKVLITSSKNGKPAGSLLLVGVIGNLVALGYFKYMNFFIDIANQTSGIGFSHLDIILPIGISFYTFIQIGFLVEAHAGQVDELPFWKYLTFATFFPCVTAGPLVLQREIFDQMKDRTDSAADMRRIAVGLTLFGIGLFKKVVIADSIAPFANVAFDGVAAGQGIDAVNAWAGSLAYTLQLYFDFSGYSDMAIGLGAIFGLKLPLNFNSPFKATSISDFWQRWHMTMTRFFTTYVYSPVAINGMRKAVANQYSPTARYMIAGAWPIILTMLVAGIWHGAGWTFVLFGLIHGVAIAINNGWKQFKMPNISPIGGWILTMSVVVSGLVVFRAPDVATAMTILSTMWGLSSILPAGPVSEMVSLDLTTAFCFIVALGAICLIAPNSQEILSRNWISTNQMPEKFSLLTEDFKWRPAIGWSVVTAVMIIFAVGNIGSESSFLYYQF
ncbi:MAG: MBOAT family O-acyltransferase [Pseudomonadota bacterium]